MTTVSNAPSPISCGENMDPIRDSKLTGLSRLEKLILEHVVRDKITTNEMIQKRFLEMRHPSAVTRITSRLTERGWLCAFPLLYPTKYFVAGKRTASAYGLASGRTQPMGPQSLPTEYAILEYTAANSSCVRRLTCDEIRTLIPWYGEEHTNIAHCHRETTDGWCLELLRVDLGGSADHVARKCKGDLESRLTQAKFRELVSSGGFSIVVITGSTAKAEAVLQALDQHVWPSGIVFRTSVFFSLIPLLPRSL